MSAEDQPQGTSATSSLPSGEGWGGVRRDSAVRCAAVPTPTLPCGEGGRRRAGRGRMTAMLRLDHMQIAIPAGAETTCREFYVGLLGMGEVQKPPELAKRGGIWVKSGEVMIHLG